MRSPARDMTSPARPLGGPRLREVRRPRPQETEESRRRRSVLLVAGPAVVVAAVAATGWLLVDVTDEGPPTRDELCAQLDTLLAVAADDGLFSTQALNRAARRMSDLGGRYEQAVVPDGELSVAQAADDLRTVTSSVAWEVADLVTATRPVALECGWTWPVSATPPAPSPTPPPAR